MTIDREKLEALHKAATPGEWETEIDPIGEGDHATLIQIPQGLNGTWIARTEHNWHDASDGERRISRKEATVNAELIACLCSESTRAAIITAITELDALRAALQHFGTDYMTSEAHHPGYVLIPTEQFDRIRAALQQKDKDDE